MLSAIFGVLALIDGAQALLALLERSGESSTLIALHFGTGAAAVVLFALLSAAYFLANSQQSARQISTERVYDR